MRDRHTSTQHARDPATSEVDSRPNKVKTGLHHGANFTLHPHAGCVNDTAGIRRRVRCAWLPAESRNELSVSHDSPQESSPACHGHEQPLGPLSRISAPEPSSMITNRLSSTRCTSSRSVIRVMHPPHLRSTHQSRYAHVCSGITTPENSANRSSELTVNSTPHRVTPEQGEDPQTS